jgi:hypothetical protein
METKSDVETQYPNLQWREVTSKRSVANNQFARGVLDFDFSVGGVQSFIPKLSYFKVDYELTAKGYDSDTTIGQPTKTSVTTYAQNACGALFNSSSFRAGGALVSQVEQYHAQVDICHKRTGLTGGQVYSVCKGASQLEPNFQKRCNDVSNSSSDDCDLEVIPLADDRAIDPTAVVAGTGLVTGTNTAFTRLRTGDYVVINGTKFEVSSVVDDISLSVRANDSGAPIATDGLCEYGLKRRNGEGNNTLSAIYQPPLGIMSWDGEDGKGILGAGEYRFTLNPNSNYKKGFVECKIPEAVEGVDYDLDVKDIRLYIAMCDHRKADGKTYLVLKETEISSKKLDSGKSNRLDFTIPATTNMVTAMVQDTRSGSDPSLPPSAFRCEDASEQNLTSLQLTYAGLSKPSTKWDSEFSIANAVNQVQHLLENQQALSGCYTELFSDWTQSPTYTFSFNKDQNDRSTQIQTQTTFDTEPTNANLLVASHYTNQVTIRTEGGVVVSVTKIQA